MVAIGPKWFNMGQKQHKIYKKFQNSPKQAWANNLILEYIRVF